MPKDFVYLRSVDPSILQDMSYAGPNNFTGKPVPGYGAAECILWSPVAEALKRVQLRLVSEGLTLKVYDCYRPARAVKAFADWASDGKPSPTTKRFFPRLNKNELFALHYISRRSGHSRGNAVDLTIVRLPVEQTAPFDPTRSYGPCTGPRQDRAPDNSIDMGTGFDCFDAKSHTASTAISAEERSWRAKLVDAMERHNFKNFAGEWWHFTYQVDQASKLRDHDFPIVPYKGAGSPRQTITPADRASSEGPRLRSAACKLGRFL